MAVDQIAAAHAERQVALARRAAEESVRLWSLVDPANIAASWRALLVQVLAVVGTSQAAAAASAGVYVGDVVDSYGLRDEAAGRVLPGAFAGIASDGRSLAGLLNRPAVTALRQIGSGATPSRALASGRFVLDMAVRTQVADAGRTADGVAITARPQLTGYVRMIVGKTCARCLILAGRRYSWNQGFQRHPRCLPGGVVVSTPGVEAATRRWYEGELVILRTAAGHELPVTGNHPVLTDRGWLPANLLQEGDHVVRGLLGHAVPAAVRDVPVPDEDQVPTRIEDLWRAYSVLPLRRVPTSAEDFHGDGGHGEVDVVPSDGLLRDRLLASLDEPARKLALFVGDGAAERIVGRSPLAEQRAAAKLIVVASDSGQDPAEFLSMLGRAASLGSGGGPIGSLDVGLARLPQTCCVCGGSEFNLSTSESEFDGPAGYAVSHGDDRGAITRQIFGGDLLDRKRTLLERWDAPADPFSVESRGVYADRGRDLLDRLSGQVELDRVIEARRVSWSGHVYNLSSVEGWYLAANIILSNCDCRHVPVSEDAPGDMRTDPRAYFDALSRVEQDQLLGKAGAAAVRDGANLAKVVNARRGMVTADGKLFTTEAAGRRPRIMPEQILRDANGSRDEAIRLLKLHRYIL